MDRKARLYEAYRLPYPIEPVDEVLAQTGAVACVADIGAGTGQLVRIFAQRVKRCWAVEPSAGMRQVANEALADLGNVEVREGSAESTGLPDNSVDLIVVGNAFHRFRAECADEFRRILKPGGWCAVFSYGFTNGAFSDYLFSRLSALAGLSGRTRQNWHRLSTDILLEPDDTKILNYDNVNAQGWEAYFGAACSGVESPEPDDPEFKEFEAINRDAFENFSENGTIRMEYATTVVLGRPSF